MTKPSNDSARNEIMLGLAILAVSAAAALFAGGYDGHMDLTLLFVTVPMGIYQIATGLRRMRRGKEIKNMAEIISIRNVNGHYEAYLRGRFICSGDTRRECEETAEEALYGAA